MKDFDAEMHDFDSKDNNADIDVAADDEEVKEAVNGG